MVEPVDTDMNVKGEDPGEEVFYNKEFVKTFESFKTYEDAADFIADWIREKKHNATEFTEDLPAILEIGIAQKEQINKGELKDFNKDLIFSQKIDGSDDDFIVWFCLNLMFACSMHDKVPTIINRILMNSLAIQIDDGEVIFTATHLQWAMDKLPYIRAEMIFDYVSKFKLEKLVKSDDFKNLAAEHLDKGRILEAAYIISKFKFHADFEYQIIIGKLIDLNKINVAEIYVENQPEMRDFLIESLTTNEHAKKAAGIIERFNLNIDNYPGVKERLMKGTTRYYLGRFLYQKKSSADYMSLYKVEDLMIGYRPMLGYVVEDLVHKNLLNDAKGIFLRNNLHGFVREEIEEELNDWVYKQEEDVGDMGVFGPLSDNPETYLHMPKDVKVVVIDKEERLNDLLELLDEPYVGVDSEWRPQMVRFHKTKPSLFQISGQKTTFLVDFFTLNKEQLLIPLDKILTKIFLNDKSTIVGFSWDSDLQMFLKSYPFMGFYKYTTNFIDAQTYFSKACKQGPISGLAKVCETIYGKPLCKKEQMSNWERRPLRESQKHYGALDAYILVDIIQELGKRGEAIGIPIKNFTITLDKTAMKAQENDNFADGDVTNKPQTQFNGPRGKKRFDKKGPGNGPQGGTQILVANVTADMKSQGFMCDKNLFVVHKIMRQNGAYVVYDHDCKDSFKIFDRAVKENRIFVTTDMKMFNKKVSHPRVCIPFREKPDKQYEILNGYFNFK